MPALPVADAGCPCAAGYHCCPIEDRCLPAAEACPLSRNCPLPPTAPRVLVVGATDITNPTPNLVPLDDAGTLLLNHGPQGGGGYHVWTQLELLGIDPSPGLTITRSLFDPADEARTAATALRFQVDQPTAYCKDDRFFLLQDPPRVYVCPSLRPGQAMAGRDLVLRVEVVDRSGGPPQVGERTIHPVCPDGDANCSTSSVTGCAAP